MAMVHIGVEGLSAAGKSDIGGLLAKPTLLYSVRRDIFKMKNGLREGPIDVKFFKEQDAENPFLKDFYDSGMKEVYAFASQMFYLHSSVVMGANIKRWNGVVGLEDRTIWGHGAYAENLRRMGKLSEKAYAEYCRHRDAMVRIYKISEPDGIILLNISLDTCIKRLRKRKTGETLSRRYWGKIIELYEQKFTEIAKRIPVVRIDANRDFIVDEDYVGHIAEQTNVLIRRILIAKGLVTDEKQRRQHADPHEKHKFPIVFAQNGRHQVPLHGPLQTILTRTDC